jgi:hypothetical protein
VHPSIISKTSLVAEMTGLTYSAVIVEVAVVVVMVEESSRVV